MTAVPLFDHHHGCHCAPPSALVMFFRRALRLPWRKPAAPADLGAAGAATPLDGLPVMRDRMISEVRAEYDTRRTRQHADLMHAGYARAVDRLRQEAGLPTIEEMHAEYFRLPQRTPGAALRQERAAETLTDLPPARFVPDVPAPVYQQACTADVLAAEQQAVMLP